MSSINLNQRVRHTYTFNLQVEPELLRNSYGFDCKGSRSEGRFVYGGTSVAPTISNHKFLVDSCQSQNLETVSHD